MSDWSVVPKPVDPELTDTYDHATYPPARTHFPSLKERLDSATWDMLKALASGIGEPDAGTTEPE